MVTRAYMTEKPSPPGTVHRLLDQRAIPALIDVAGAVEALVERLAVATRRAPATVLVTGCLAGLLLGRLVLRRR